MTTPLLLLIDGHSLAFRCYYAFAKSRQGALRTSTGIPTSICFGFLNALMQVIERQQPHSVAIAFDRSEPTFRHEADENYKAQRKETPDDFIPDFQNLLTLLDSLQVTRVTKAGYEADDVLATLAAQASEAGYQVKILTGDRDLFQLVNPAKNISILYLDSRGVKSGSYEEFTPDLVEEKLGVQPEQVVDLKALAGDASDNYKGVQGIGDKTAIKLIQEFGSLDNIYANLDQIKGATRKKLETDKEQAYHCQNLAKIEQAVPIEVDLKDLKLQGFELTEATEILVKLELKKFIQNIGKLQKVMGAETIELPYIPPAAQNGQGENNGQLSIFQSSSAEVVSPPEPVPPKNEAIAPQIIDTTDKLKHLITILEQQTDPTNPVAWDTETTGLDPRQVALVGIGCCWGKNPDELAYIPLSHKEGEQLPFDQVAAALKPILEGEQYPKVLQNAKFDRGIFYYQGIHLKGVVFDTMLASYVLHPESKHNLTDLSFRYLGNIIAQSYSDLGLTKNKPLQILKFPKPLNIVALMYIQPICYFKNSLVNSKHIPT